MAVFVLRWVNSTYKSNVLFLKSPVWDYLLMDRRILPAQLLVLDHSIGVQLCYVVVEKRGVKPVWPKKQKAGSFFLSVLSADTLWHEQ